MWSSDGSRIVFTSSREAGEGLFEKPAGGAASERLLMKSPGHSAIASDWSRDGRNLISQDADDIWVLADGKPAPFTKTQFQEGQGQFAPNGQWIAYTSNESKRSEIYVQSFPASGGKWLISTAGGNQPRWRRDGRELFYVALDGTLMAVPVKPAVAFEIGVAEKLFHTQLSATSNGFQYSVSGDGQRFLVAAPVQDTTARPVTVITNWLAGVKK